MIQIRFTNDVAQCRIGSKLVISKSLRKQSTPYKRDLEKLRFYSTILKELPNLVPADQLPMYIQQVNQLEDEYTIKFNDNEYDSD